MSKFLIVDGSSLLHRAFFALPLTMTNAKGEHTNAVYGFATMFNKILKDEKPDMTAVCFDKSRVTFRTEIYAEYKGQRAATPSELSEQFELTKHMLEAMGVVWEEVAGFEADDIIGTLAKRAARDGHEVLILTGDRDSYQLIDDNIRVVMTKKGISQTELWDKSMLQEHYGLTPAQMIDLKALMGDASDNIPGVAGVGEKTALKLLAEYHDLDTVLANIENISAKGLRTKLENGRESALLSRTLAIIDCNMDGLDDLDKYLYADVPLAANQPLIDFYRAMDFKTFLKPLETGAVQSLFGNVAVSDDVKIPAFAEVSVREAAEALAGEPKLLLNICGDVVAMANADLRHILVVDTAELAANWHLFAQADLLTDDFKPLMSKILRVGGRVDNFYEDIALAAYLLNPAQGDFSAPNLAASYLGKNKPTEKAHTAAELAALGVSLLPRLAEEIWARLAAEKLEDLYANVERPLAKVLAKMEAVGIRAEVTALQELSEEFSAIEGACAARIYELAGKSFNINSPKQLGEVLFEDLGIEAQKKKTKTGYATGVEVLEQLAADYEIAGKVLEYRGAAKLRSTYAEGLQALIAGDGRIHTTFNQTVTATGRLSSTDPNLQNIPVRTEQGRRLRRAFHAGEGCVLLAADYSQIELRVLADISEDEVLRQSFYNNEDIHARTAAEVLGKSISEVTAEERRSAKAVNFGIVYGISDFGLSKDLGISRAAAKAYIEAYLGRYQGVSRYMNDIVESGRSLGYVATKLGRMRRLPELKSSRFNERSFAERTALNTPIQGTAADIIKLAMLKVDEAITEHGLKSKMLLQVHDELIFDVPLAELDEMKSLVKSAMESAFELAVPLVVDMKIGENWYDMAAE